MLSITILTLLITSNVISRLQAEEQEERKAQSNGTQAPVYGSDSVIQALKVQKRDTLNIVPESYVEQTDHADKSQSGNRLRRDSPYDYSNIQNDISMFDPPANHTGQINFIGSRTYQSESVFNYTTKGRKKVSYGSIDVLIGNSFSGDATNLYGPTLVQKNNSYLVKNVDADYGATFTHIGNSFSKDSGKNDIFSGVVVQKDNIYSENPKNKTLLAISINQSNNAYPEWVENNKDALKPSMDWMTIHQSNDSEAGMNTKNNTEGQVDIAEQNATDSQGNSSSTNYDSSSHVENKILHTKEKEAYADKHSEPNRQMSLSSNVFCSLSYSLIILLKYAQF